jgi:hypothetical protein
MASRIVWHSLLYWTLAAALACVAQAQVSRADYDRALNLQEKSRGILNHAPYEASCIEGTTYQVVDRLIKANKDFDLLVVPGGEHGAGGKYGQRKLMDFFVRNLLGEPTPQWNAEK